MGHTGVRRADIVKALGEEKAQIKAGGPIPIPDLVDIRSRTIMKNEYQKDKQRVDGGPVPAQHVLCPSRAPGVVDASRLGVIGGKLGGPRCGVLPLGLEGYYRRLKPFDSR